MDEILSHKLHIRYPRIFPLGFGAGWGFECDNGWFLLLDTLAGYLQFQADNNNHKQIVATQVKEKFGGLRFYYEGIGDAIQDGAIRFAEELSRHICETCGTFDENTNVGIYNNWYKCLCHNCEVQYKKEREIE